MRRNLNIDTNSYLSNTHTNPLSNKNQNDFIDSNKPLISPINFNPQMFPTSTKNHFNINMDSHLLQNFVDTVDTPNNKSLFRYNFRNGNFMENQTKEINMQDKILINEVDDDEEDFISKEKIKANYESTPDFPGKNPNDNNNENCLDFFLEKNKDSSAKKCLLDLDLVNRSDSANIFNDKVNDRKNTYEKFSFKDANLARNENEEVYDKSKTNKISSFSKLLTEDENKKISNLDCFCGNKTPQENIKILFSNNNTSLNNFFESPNLIERNRTQPGKISEKKNQINNNTGNLSEGKSENIPETLTSNKKDLFNKLSILPFISPSRATLNISPKSAFVVNKKLFN